MNNADYSNNTGLSGVKIDSSGDIASDKTVRAYELYESKRYNDAISLVEGDEERKRTIDLLMDHYGRGDFGYDERLMSAILVFRLEVDRLTCKATRGWKEKMGC